MHNAQRSVERVAGVKAVKIDLNTGLAEVWYKRGQPIKPVELWKAVIKSGFTPVRVELNGEVYQGPKPRPKVVD